MSGFRRVAVILVLCFAGTKPLYGQFLTIRLKSLDGLQKNARYLSQLAGDTQFGARMEKLAVVAVPVALDSERDWYFYLLLPPAPGDDPTTVLRCPTQKESNFLNYLRTFLGRTTPTTDNRHSVETEVLPFSNILLTDGFAFLGTRTLNNDEDVMSAPYPGGKKNENDVISVSFDLDAIPMELPEA